MPRFYVEKDGEWNIFSTIIDGFVFDEFVCLDALKARLLYERYKELTEDIDSLLTDRPRVNVMSYSDAIERIGEDEQTEPQTEGIWNAGYKTGYDKGYKDAQKVKDSQDLVKTENSSEKPNNCEECKHWNDTEDDCADRHGCRTTTEDWQDWKDLMWAEAIVTEPTTEDCSTVPTSSKMEQVDEPQTCSVNGRPYKDCCNCEYFKCTADEPQTERSE